MQADLRVLGGIVLTVLLWTLPAFAAVPTATQVEGLLQSSGGGPAADGKYPITFAIYGQAEGGQAAWTEGPVEIAVAGGQFTHALGSVKPLDPKLFAALPQAWIGVKIDADPELPRKATLAVPFALRTALAEGLDCSGCVTLANLDAEALAAYAKTADLAAVATSGAYADLTGAPDLSAFAQTASLAKVATSGLFADLEGGPDLTAYAKSADLADVAKTGAYADLGDLPVLAKVNSACGTGLVVAGLKADGSLDCVAAMTSLPPDGLNEVSNNLLTNQFTDATASAKTPLGIPDNSPVGVTDAIDVPDFGIAQGVTIHVTLSSSDIAQVKVALVDPANTTYLLYDKSGTGTQLKTSWPSPTKTVSGDLAGWIGKNPKGKWQLQVIDSKFLNNTTDGKVEAWSVSVQTLSSKKVAAGGAFVFVSATTPPVPCNPSNFGATYGDPVAKALYVCNGSEYATVSLLVPGSKGNPAFSCKDLLAKVPTTKDGSYWIDGNGGDPADAQELLCDMANGGWTRLAVDDFEAAATGWSMGTVSTCGTLGKILGGYNTFSTGCFNRQYDLAGVAHTEAKVSLTYVSIDSSDGENGSVQLDGVTKWSQTLNNCGLQVATNWCGGGSGPPCFGDSKYDVAFTSAHSAAKATVNACSTLDQVATDESFGIDNVVVWVK
jgi:subtilisin-like proprotein convertase family protein